MPMFRPLARLLFLVTLGHAHAASPSPKPAPAPSEQAVSVHFPVSCDVAVQADFDRAVTLLHHMTYPQARAAFEARPH